MKTLLTEHLFALIIEQMFAGVKRGKMGKTAPRRMRQNKSTMFTLA